MSKIDVILDVYETHSISKTAVRLKYTQSAVSQAIRNYEKEIGVTLFKRSKTGMSPLTGTDSIFEELKKIRDSENHIEQIAANINGLESGLIRIGTIQSISYHWLPGILKKIYRCVSKYYISALCRWISGIKCKIKRRKTGLYFHLKIHYGRASLRNTGTG